MAAKDYYSLKEISALLYQNHEFISLFRCKKYCQTYI